MIKGSKAQRILADKAYASKANRAALKGEHRDGILHKGLRGRSLRQSQKRFNKRISKQRFRVEGCLGTVSESLDCIGTLLRGCQNPRTDGHGRHRAELAQGRKQDHLKQTNLCNRITQTDNANPSAEIAADWKIRLLKS
jgi:hypothetical protein